MSMAVDVEAGAAAQLKVLGEPLRWEIVRRLASEDLCTCHLVDELGVAQPLVSHHLRVLREAGLVRTEPCGAFTYYVLDRDAVSRVAGELAVLGSPSAPARRRPCS
jgi:DNA-binding transcriptional ArsR family regulator